MNPAHLPQEPGQEPPSSRARVRRKPYRARYDATAVHAVLDEALVCHVAAVRDGQPVVLPMVHGRVGDVLYLHGSAVAGLFRDMAAGSPVCVTATIVDGLILARSARNHSMNYRSVTVHGDAAPLTSPDEILAGQQAIVDHVIKGRWDSVREPTEAEIRETGLWRVPVTEASVKTRTGSTIDPESDRSLPVWAGVIPVQMTFGAPVAADGVPNGIRSPEVRRRPALCAGPEVTA